MVKFKDIFCACAGSVCIKMEKVFLVCVQNRTREVRVSVPEGASGNVASLESAVRERFSDLPSVRPTSQLILQVRCSCKYSGKWAYWSKPGIFCGKPEPY